MRLLVVSNGFPPRGRWGTEYYTHELVAALIARGHEVAVLHPDRTGRLPRYTIERAAGLGGVPVYVLHNAGDPRKRFEDSYRNAEVERVFGEVLDEYRPDIVHFTYLLWGLSVRMPLVARERGVPAVATLTDYGLICHRGQMFDWRLQRCGGPHPAGTCARCIRTPSVDDARPAKVLARRIGVAALAAVGGAGRVVVEADLEQREAAVREAFDALSRTIAPTRVIGDAFRRAGVPEEKLVELCYAIDAEPYAVARPEPPRDRVVFGFLGQFTPHKGLHVLLEAVDRMAHRLPESVEPWEVRLYGKPAGGRHRMYAERQRFGDLGPRVRVMDPFEPEAAPQVLADLHALVMPSLWDENAPLTCLQARAAGIPMVASDVPGIAEVIEPGRHGLLFPPGDAAALADGLREVVLGRVRRTPDPTLPVTLAEHVARIESLYEEAVGERLRE